MHVEVMPTLIDQFRETFEGETQKGMTWITDGGAGSAIFGIVDSLSPAEAYAAPTPGARSIAAHVEHLRFSLDLTHERMLGKDPKADWASSFNLPGGASDASWNTLKGELRRAYDAVLGVIEKDRQTPPEKMVPLYLVGLAAMTAHNAYHLGAIRQMVKAVRAR
jgi:hypothetical protein